MPTIPEYTLVVPNPDPASPTSVGSEEYAPRPKSFWLSQMLRKLSNNGGRLYPREQANPAHRILDSIAIELARIDQYFSDSTKRAIIDGVYEAFAGDFTPRLPRSFATGYIELVRRSPAPSNETIPAGTVVSSASGQSYVTLEAALVSQGGVTPGSLISVRAEAPGVAGNAPAGSIVAVVSPVSGEYRVSNPSPIDGGRERETGESVRRRWAQYIGSLGTGSPDAILAAARGTSVIVGSTLYTPRDVALLLPWRIPGTNIPPGTFECLIDSGGGTAPVNLVAAVNTAIQAKVAVGVMALTSAANPFVVSPQITYSYRTGESTTQIQASLTLAWNDFAADTLIEDGTGRGNLAVSDLPEYLFAAHPGLRNRDDFKVRFGTPPVELSVVQAPAGHRILAGVPTFISIAV